VNSLMEKSVAPVTIARFTVFLTALKRSYVSRMKLTLTECSV